MGREVQDFGDQRDEYVWYCTVRGCVERLDLFLSRGWRGVWRWKGYTEFYRYQAMTVESNHSCSCCTRNRT